MADAFFDTTFFIDVRRGTYPGADALWRDLLQGRVRGAYSPITTFELWINQRITRDEEVFYELAFDIMEEAFLTAAAAQQAGLWLREFPRNTAERRGNDALIAATASMRNEPVYTANPRDFRAFDIPMRAYR